MKSAWLTYHNSCRLRIWINMKKLILKRKQKSTFYHPWIRNFLKYWKKKKKIVLRLGNKRNYSVPFRLVFLFLSTWKINPLFIPEIIISINFLRQISYRFIDRFDAHILSNILSWAPICLFHFLRFLARKKKKKEWHNNIIYRR